MIGSTTCRIIVVGDADGRRLFYLDSELDILSFVLSIVPTRETSLVCASMMVSGSWFLAPTVERRGFFCA